MQAPVFFSRYLGGCDANRLEQIRALNPGWMTPTTSKPASGFDCPGRQVESGNNTAKRDCG